MAEFESAISKKRLNKFVVDDVSPTQEQDKNKKVEEIIQARREAMDDRLPKESIIRLEFLMGIGLITDDVIIGNYTFTLRTLKAKEYKEVTKFIRELAKSDPDLTQTELSMIVRREQLVYGLYAVNGEKTLDLFNSLDEIRYFLDELQESVVSLLTKKLNELIAKTNKDFGLIEPDVAQKVEEDLKK